MNRRIRKLEIAVEANPRIGIPRTHPDFKKARRERFAKLLKDARRILAKDLTEAERDKLAELYRLVKQNNN